jgi:hypothetical protein
VTSTSGPSASAEQRQGIWRYPPGAAVAAASAVGYAIDATDGFVGTVGVARDEAWGAYLIVLGGPWNGGRSLMIPAGTIKQVEREARVVHLSCSRQQLRDAPAYENDRYQDAAYRGEIGGYYEGLTSRSRLGALGNAVRPPSFGTAAVAVGGRLAG